MNTQTAATITGVQKSAPFSGTDPMFGPCGTKRAAGPIQAAHLQDGKAISTRPLCPYPQLARWDGKGSRDAAESYTCGVAK